MYHLCDLRSRIHAEIKAKVAHLALKVLIVVNWIGGVMILVLLLASPNREWIMSAFKLTPSPDTDRLILALRVIASIGLTAIPLHYIILKRLIAMVETVRNGDPFVAVNAERLQTIAWVLLTLQIFGLIIEAITKSVSTPAHPLNLDAGFSVSGWLGVLLTFILARVFAAGAVMRDDLEGTV